MSNKNVQKILGLCKVFSLCTYFNLTWLQLHQFQSDPHWKLPTNGMLWVSSPQLQLQEVVYLYPSVFKPQNAPFFMSGDTPISCWNVQVKTPYLVVSQSIHWKKKCFKFHKNPLCFSWDIAWSFLFLILGFWFFNLVFLVLVFSFWFWFWFWFWF